MSEIAGLRNSFECSDPWNQSGSCERRRFAAVGAVALLHALVLWLLAEAIRPGNLLPANRELEVAIFHPRLGPPHQPAAGYMFRLPQDVFVPPPDIEITPHPGRQRGIAAQVIRGRLAPRLDPAHVNERPELPPGLQPVIAKGFLRLLVLVLPDGSIGDAKIIRSTGDGEIDQLAVNWVRNEWRYLPALMNGEPVEAWTTVVVRFAPIS